MKNEQPGDKTYADALVELDEAMHRLKLELLESAGPILRPLFSLLLKAKKRVGRNG
jgi:hypothetical protein